MSQTKSTSQTEQELIAVLLTEIIEKAEPELSAGLLVASTSTEFDLPLFTTLRGKEDDASETVFNQIQSLQFVQRPEESKIGLPSLHRGLLHRMFMQFNREGLIDTHRRAAEFWQQDDFANSYEATCTQIFHTLLAAADITDPTQVNGFPELLRLFQGFAQTTNIPAIEKLIAFCISTRFYLSPLEPTWLQAFDDLVSLMTARLEQLRGDYDLASTVLAPVMARRDIVPSYAPYLLRTHGENLAYQHKFSEAIDLFTEALSRLEKEVVQRKVVNPAAREWEILEAEQASLMVAMGDAHLGLALAARGSKLPRLPRSQFDRVRSWFNSLASLPLIFYLTFRLGRRVWRPDFWVAIGTEDWIIVRLISTAYRWYQRATPLMNLRGTHREKSRLEEKTGRLFLELGDHSKAVEIYEQLWQKGANDLSEYRRGHVALGLAEATFLAGNTGHAFVLIEEAIQIFEKFKDLEYVTQGQALLARILGEMRNYPAAVSSYNKAFRGYETLENWTDATHHAEYLEILVQEDAAFPETLKEQAIRLSDSLLKRQYVRQFVHPGLKQLRFTAIASFALMVLAIPLLVLNTSEAIGILPITDFNPGHLLDLDQPIEIGISQGLLEAAGVKPGIVRSTAVLAQGALLAVVGYGLLLLFLGIIFLRVTPIDSVEIDQPADRITLTRSGIIVGDEHSKIKFDWDQIKQLVRANLSFVQHIPLYSSSYGVQTERSRLTIRGQTAWFSSLRRRIEWQATDANVKRLDYTIGRSVMLVLYVVGVLGMVSFLLAVWLRGDFLWIELGDLALRPADIYPWLFLTLFLPPVWWGLVVRWRQKLSLQPASFWPWSLLIGGLALTGLQLSTRLRPVLTVPDIYVPLLTISLLLGGGIFIWQVRELNRRVYKRMLRYPVLIIAIILASLNGARIVRDTQAWSHLVTGRSFMTEGQSLPTLERAMPVYQTAQSHFMQARDLQNMPIAWLAEQEAARMPFGLPAPEALVSTQATLGIGATHAMLGDYEEAIVEFKQASRVLKTQQQQGMLNAWVGIARQSERPDTLQDGEVADQDRYVIVAENYDTALEDFGWALEQDPAGDNYLLYQALSHHTLGNLTQARENYLRALNREDGRGLTEQERAQAFIGLGWVLYEEKNYGGALLQFEQAILASRSVNLQNPDNPAAVRELADAELGFGYTAYALGQYDLADRSFAIAHELLPFDPVPLVALGTVNLRLGTFAHDLTRGNDVCLLNDASPEAKESAENYYVKAAEYLTLAAEKLDQTDAEIAHTFRTRGQVHFLLRNCPNMVLDEQLAAGSQSYTRAISYAPQDDRYWQLRARFGMSRWLNSQQDQALEPVLFRALADIRQAIKLNPNNSNHEDWYDSIFEQVSEITGETAVLEWEAAIDADIAENGETSNGLTPLDFTGCYAAQFIGQEASTYLPKANQLFRITWQLRNRGSCVWDDEVRFKHVGGDRMGAQEIVNIPNTATGGTAEITVPFVAPSEPGNYRGEWVLIDENGLEISGRQWFVIEVK